MVNREVELQFRSAEGLRLRRKPAVQGQAAPAFLAVFVAHGELSQIVTPIVHLTLKGKLSLLVRDGFSFDGSAGLGICLHGQREARARFEAVVVLIDRAAENQFFLNRLLQVEGVRFTHDVKRVGAPALHHQ